MNKQVFGRKLSRSRPAREALFASIVRSVILSGKIDTTHAKAKAVVGMLEKTVTLAKKGSLASRRKILSNLDNAKDAVEVLFSKVVPAFSGKSSGYTRIISLPPRRGDNAKMARIEWTEVVDYGKQSTADSKPQIKEKHIKVEKKAVASKKRPAKRQ